MEGLVSNGVIQSLNNQINHALGELDQGAVSKALDDLGNAQNRINNVESLGQSTIQNLENEVQSAIDTIQNVLPQ